MTPRSPNPPPFPRLFTYRSDSPDGERRWPNLPAISLGWRLLGLVLLCLIPRVWMASLVGPICNDGYYYITIASALREGNSGHAFAYLNLNIYPVILVGLNSLGLEWILAGKAWSVVVASLAVLPLFGWVRRMFSDQVAWTAGFLYSVHAEFAERSFEPIRDPTFWFLFNLCLYTTVRAVSEVKYRWFFWNGVVLTLAVHTRSEGWLLTIPLFLWSAKRLLLQIDCRRRLLAGLALCLAVLPGTILLVNLTVLRDQPEWHFGRLSHFVVAWTWVEDQLPSDDPEPAATEDSLQAAATAPVPAAVEKAPPMSPAIPPPKPASALKYFKEMATALEQINLGLLVFGLCWTGRELIQWDRFVLFVMAFAFAVAIWILYDYHGLINGRYFLPIYLTLVPFNAIGYLLVFYALWNFAERFRWSWFKPEYTAVFLILLAIGLGWTDTVTTDHRSRDREHELGIWLDENHGPIRTVVSDFESVRAGYRAKGDVPDVIQPGPGIPKQFRDQPPDLLILGCQDSNSEARNLVRAEAGRCGLVPLALPRDLETTGRFLIFVRPSKTGIPLRTATERPVETGTRSLVR